MAVRAGRLYLILVVVLIAGAAALRVADPFFVQALRLIAFDSYQKLAPQAYDPNLPVRIVDIDEKSLARIGQWPWPRTTMAALLKKLQDEGAATVVFDVLFSEPDQTSLEEVIKHLPEKEAAAMRPALAGAQSHDLVFADAIAAAPTVLATALVNNRTGGKEIAPKAGFAIAGDDPRPFIANFTGATGNLPILDAKAAGIGAINWIPDRDQVIRRIPLVYRVGNQIVPALVAEALRVAQGASTFVLKASNASGETAFGEQTGLNHIKIGGLEVPTDSDGGIWLRFRPANPSAYIPAWKVLDGGNDPGEVAGKIILVGTSAPGLIDLRATPLDSAIPGVEIHAQAIEHLLSGRSLTRPDYALALELAILIFLGVAVSFVLPRVSAGGSALIGLSVIALLGAGGWIAFRYGGLLLDPTYPALSLSILIAAATFHVYRRVELQRGAIRDAFGHFVAPAVVDELIAHPERLELGGEVRELTLMFCDVRDFTGLSERMNAQELTTFINGLLTPLTDIVLEARGTIDKYMGDAIMAFWNAPLEDPDHAGHACEAARRIVARMETLNAEWRRQAEAAGRPYQTVRIGIGLNTGMCCVGNLGSAQRFDYSAIGDDVNIASRFEGLTKLYRVPLVVGEATIGRLEAADVLELGLVRVKGRNQAGRVFTLADVVGLAADQAARLAPLHEGLLTAYRAGDWAGAAKAAADCRALGIGGLDAFYAAYLARIAACRAAAPAAWDGVDAAETK